MKKVATVIIVVLIFAAYILSLFAASKHYGIISVNESVEIVNYD